MFQFDFGDHRSYFVFELVFNLQNETTFLIGAIPAIIFSIVYAVYTFQLVKLTQMRDKQIKVWVDALIALLLMVGMVYGLTKLYYLMI